MEHFHERFFVKVARKSLVGNLSTYRHKLLLIKSSQLGSISCQMDSL